MHRFSKYFLSALLALAMLACPLSAQDRDAVVTRVRGELAALLKKEATKLPLDMPVTEFGADDLDIVEWVMAVEEAFHIAIPDDRIVDPKSKKPRKELSISYMAGIVFESLEKAKSKKR